MKLAFGLLGSFLLFSLSVQADVPNRAPRLPTRENQQVYRLTGKISDPSFQNVVIYLVLSAEAPAVGKALSTYDVEASSAVEDGVFSITIPIDTVREAFEKGIQTYVVVDINGNGIIDQGEQVTPLLSNQ